MPSRGLTVALLTAMATLVTPGVVGPAATHLSAQVLVGLRANWSDLETWNRYIESTRQNEVGLGLHLSGPGGVMLVAFTGTLSVSTPRTAPREIHVQVAAPQTANPNAVRTPTVRFVARDKAGDITPLDLSGPLVVDSLAPGAALESGATRMTVREFQTLIQATAVSANLLGFEVQLRPDQLDALREFAKRVYLSAPPTTPESSANSGEAPGSTPR
jgi:hypothetical protein